jgi:hypothetical protein
MPSFGSTHKARPLKISGFVRKPLIKSIASDGRVVAMGAGFLLVAAMMRKWRLGGVKQGETKPTSSLVSIWIDISSLIVVPFS